MDCSGDEDNSLFGFSVATAGDVNSDGYSDIIVGAGLHDSGAGSGADRGRAYVYLGSPSGPATTATWIGSGDENIAYYGYSVATAGDVNGDGYSDICVGAYRHDAGAGLDANRGRAYVYFGSPSGPVTAPAWTGSGDQDGAFYGSSVATAGDVNGDGYSDIIAGASYHDSGAGSGADRGEAYVYLGSSSGPETTPAWTGSGDDDLALFGWSVATAGDVNGDGYSDMIVAAPGHNAGAGPGATRGRAYVYFGSPSGPATTAAWTGSGDQDGATFGFSVATAGDVDGDGYSEIIVGAPGHNADCSGMVFRGRAYVYFGSAAGPATTEAWTGSGDEDEALLGSSVATAGDVNSDGNSDIIVGAYAHDAGAASNAIAGRVYVYLGFSSSLFSENFGDGILSTMWTYEKPEWSEVDGDLMATPVKKKAIAIASPAFAGCSICTVEAGMSTKGSSNKVWLYGWRMDKDNVVEVLIKKKTTNGFCVNESTAQSLKKILDQQPLIRI